MHKFKKDYLVIDLTLFGEGAAASAGSDGSAGSDTSGVSAGVSLPARKGRVNPLADVVYGKQDNQTQFAQVSKQMTDEASDRSARFESLIRGEYKDLYDARVSETIQKRLKNSKETTEKYEKLTPTLELLGRKYGISDISDIDALNKAIEDDDTYYEDEALEKGMSVEQLKAVKKMERENAQLKEQMRQDKLKKDSETILNGWMQQSDALKAVYPGFDLNAELSNQRFVDLLRNNIDVRTAYEVIHKDEIIPAAMHFTAQQTARNITNSIIANGKRPAENGLSSQSSVNSKSNVASLTKADRAEIIRRVQRGDRITF